MKSSSIPTSVIEPLSAPMLAPIAAPRKGTKKISPNRKPQKAPLIAPAPPMLCSSRVLGFLLPWGQLTTAASSRVISCRSCRPCRAISTLSAPAGSSNFSTDSVAKGTFLLLRWIARSPPASPAPDRPRCPRLYGPRTPYYTLGHRSSPSSCFSLDYLRTRTSENSVWAKFRERLSQGARKDVRAAAQRPWGSSSPLSKSSSMCSLAACTSSGLTRISSISIWLQLRRTYSSSSASLRLAPAFRRWMMYCRTLCLRSASGPSPVPPINVSQNDPCSATATHSSCYPYRTPQSHTRIFASDNGRYSPTSWNAVKRKSNFGESPFYELRCMPFSLLSCFGSIDTIGTQP